jgi:hypothetical protein
MPPTINIRPRHEITEAFLSLRNISSGRGRSEARKKSGEGLKREPRNIPAIHARLNAASAT